MRIPESLISRAQRKSRLSQATLENARKAFFNALLDPLTGFFRDGCCNTDDHDRGLHVVCARMTAEFLEFSGNRGNDLVTPRPEFNFPGLKPGDQWCLCALRWKEAFDAGAAPHVVLHATHERALDVVSLEQLRSRAYAH